MSKREVIIEIEVEKIGRQVFYIDTGDLSEIELKEHFTTLKKEMHDRPVVSP